jgi:hypothetical protein
MTYLFRRDGLLAGFAELLNGLGVVAQILFAADQDDRETLAEVKNLRNPLQAVPMLAAGRHRLSSCTVGDQLTFSCTLSRESGESIAKQIRIT